jgi:hypothetical protein
MISSCHGLDHLKAVPFPSDYIDPFSRAGKANHMDKPGPIEERQYLPGECWHWDTMGPTRTAPSPVINTVPFLLMMRRGIA